MGEGIADPARKKQPLTPGFAVPSPPGEGVIQPRSQSIQMYKPETASLLAAGMPHGASVLPSAPRLPGPCRQQAGPATWGNRTPELHPPPTLGVETEATSRGV